MRCTEYNRQYSTAHNADDNEIRLDASNPWLGRYEGFDDLCDAGYDPNGS